MKLRIIAALIIVAPVACHSRDPRPPLVAGAVSNHEAAAIAAQLADLLDEQADAWNCGDLQGFMSFYWRSDELTFISGEGVIRGWQATLERYKKRYPTPLEMGWLDFRDLQSNAHSADQALVTGRWRVQAHRGGKTGRFTLTFRKIEGRPPG